jgi:hypothetical protein
MADRTIELLAGDVKRIQVFVYFGDSGRRGRRNIRLSHRFALYKLEMNGGIAASRAKLKMRCKAADFKCSSGDRRLNSEAVSVEQTAQTEIPRRPPESEKPAAFVSQFDTPDVWAARETMNNPPPRNP